MHIACDLQICTWLASRISLQRPPGSASSSLQIPDIIFNTKYELLTLTNLYLDIHECILCVTSKSVPDWPPGSAAGGLQEPPGKSSGPLVCLNIGNYYYLYFLPTKNIIWKQKKNIFSVFTWNSGAGHPGAASKLSKSSFFPYTFDIYVFW